MAFIKNLTIITSALVLSACALFPSKFDANEQAKLTDIILLSQDDSVCANSSISVTVTEIDRSAQWLKIYSESLPKNEKLVDMTKNLSDITKDFRASYLKDKPPSHFYCRSKIRIINEATRKMLDVSGRRPR